MILHSLILLLAASFLLAAHTPVSAQLFKRKPTCSSVYKRCLDYSAGYGPREVRQCAEHRDTCMKTGEWKSRAFEYKNVQKK